MAAGDAEDLASVATRAEERLTALESAVFKEREEVKKKMFFLLAAELIETPPLSLLFLRPLSLSLFSTRNASKHPPFLSNQNTPLPLLSINKQLRARVAELEAELEKLRYRTERLGCSLREGDAAARRALEEVKGDRGLRSRLGRVLFGKYYLEEGEEEEAEGK